MVPEKNAIPATDLASNMPVSVPSHEVILEKQPAIPDNATVHTRQIEKVISEEEKSQLMKQINEVSDMLRTIADQLNDLNGRNLVGKGFRNFGFLTAANNSANNNPEFVPPFMDLNAYNKVEEDFLFMRDVVERLNSLTSDALTSMNILGNEAYSLSLAYYAFVRQVAMRTNNPQAESVFNYLREFFRRRNMPNVDQPTEHQLERDIHALLHDKKDGEIVIKNEIPHTIGGVHQVVDDTHKTKIAESGKIEERISD